MILQVNTSEKLADEENNPTKPKIMVQTTPLNLDFTLVSKGATRVSNIWHSFIIPKRPKEKMNNKVLFYLYNSTNIGTRGFDNKKN